MQKFRRHVECENDWDTIANPMVKKIQRFIIRSTTICIIRYANCKDLKTMWKKHLHGYKRPDLPPALDRCCASLIVLICYD